MILNLDERSPQEEALPELITREPPYGSFSWPLASPTTPEVAKLPHFFRCSLSIRPGLS
jgi:hypothetical protein